MFSRALIRYFVVKGINPLNMIPVYEKDGVRVDENGKTVEYKKGDLNDEDTIIDEVIGWTVAVRLQPTRSFVTMRRHIG